MTKNQFLKAIFTLNESFFTANGFSADKKKNEFTKTGENGFEKVQLSCAAVGARFYLTYGLLIRINSLQELVNPFTGMDEAHWNETATILSSAIFLKDDPSQKQYIVDREEDIAAVNEDFKQLMTEKGFAWFSKYRNNISILDKELNSNGALKPDYLQMLMRPLYGIAAAYLDKNPEFESIVRDHLSTWTEKAKTHAEFARNLERIEKLYQYLKTKPE
jgi:hypothetical protein